MPTREVLRGVVVLRAEGGKNDLGAVGAEVDVELWGGGSEVEE